MPGIDQWTKISEALSRAGAHQRPPYSPWARADAPISPRLELCEATALLLTEVRRLDEQNRAQEQALQAHREAFQSIVATLGDVTGTLLLQNDALEALRADLAAIQAAAQVEPLPAVQKA